MIVDSLIIWLYGIIGLFIVMGVIVVVVKRLNRFGNAQNKKEEE
jgi:hypothetical protein